MRKVSVFVILVATIGIGLPYGINGQWWGILVCLFTGTIWLFPSPKYSSQRSTLSLVIFLMVGAITAFFDHSPLWLLTAIVLLMIAWDLDHFTRVFAEYESDQKNGKNAAILFSNHLKRLGLIAALGWGIGVAALNIRVQINFAIALLLMVLLIFGLRQAARYIVNIPR